MSDYQENKLFLKQLSKRITNFLKVLIISLLISIIFDFQTLSLILCYTAFLTTINLAFVNIAFLKCERCKELGYRLEQGYCKYCSHPEKSYEILNSNNRCKERLKFRATLVVCILICTTLYTF